MFLIFVSYIICICMEWMDEWIMEWIASNQI